MRTATGRKIGETYRYFSEIHQKKTKGFLAFYAFLVFVFLSTSGKSIGAPLMTFLTCVLIVGLISIFFDTMSRDKRHMQRYTVKKESMDDRGNSTILVEWHKDHSHDWIPNKPFVLHRFRVVGG